MLDIFVENYRLPTVNVAEVMRYVGVRGEDEALSALLKECEEECAPLLTPKVVYTRLTKTELFSLIPDAGKSKGLANVLSTSDEVFLFAATVGLSVDRLIARYAQTAPSKSLFFQALGAERVERLCDCFCERREWETGERLGRRFSAGYGDFSLEAQRDIFRVLDCPKRIGVTLTEGLLICPTKSVTAIVGIGGEKGCGQACENCQKNDCEYRI